MTNEFSSERGRRVSKNMRQEPRIHFTREKRACRAKPIRALSLSVHGKCKSEMSLWVLTRHSPDRGKMSGDPPICSKKPKQLLAKQDLRLSRQPVFKIRVIPFPCRFHFETHYINAALTCWSKIGPGLLGASVPRRSQLRAQEVVEETIHSRSFVCFCHRKNYFDDRQD